MAGRSHTNGETLYNSLCQLSFPSKLWVVLCKCFEPASVCRERVVGTLNFVQVHPIVNRFTYCSHDRAVTIADDIHVTQAVQLVKSWNPSAMLSLSIAVELPFLELMIVSHVLPPLRSVCKVYQKLRGLVCTDESGLPPMTIVGLVVRTANGWNKPSSSVPEGAAIVVILCMCLHPL